MYHFKAEDFQNGLSYSEYRKLTDDLLKENKTTGTKQSDQLVEYTRLNNYRMNRIDSKIKLFDVLADKILSLKDKFYWIVLTEAWCGDSAQNLPVIAKMKYVSPSIDLKIISSTEHENILNHYLTNGSQSVPKLICLKQDTLEELFVWGPRPAEAQAIIMNNKTAEQPLSKEEIHQQLHLWYAKDKCACIQQEFMELIEKNCCSSL